MRKMKNKKSMLQSDNSTSVIISDSVAMLRAAGYEDYRVAQFADDAVSLLNDYAKLVGEGTEIEYILAKRFATIELKVFIPGKPYDPFNSGSESKKRRLKNVASLNLNTATAKISYRYALGCNIISVSLPLSERRKSVVKNPMVIAAVAGVVLGLLCQHLPADANRFIVDEIASPLMSIILGVLSGIMGPVIFISLITSIVAMDSVNDLTNLGFKIVRRFVLITLFLIAVSIAVSAFFFRSFGTGSVSFAPQQLIQMIFDIIPTNPFRSFLENKTPQLVVLGFLLGSALLILGDSVNALKEILIQINEWMMSAMKIILMVVPAIPFLSIFTMIAKGSGREMLEGWKFIAASYIVYTISACVKIIKTSVSTGIGISDLWDKIKPVVKIALTTGSTDAPMKKTYEISQKDFHIKPEFTSFWIPISSAMLSPKTTINVVIATLMVAELTGIAMSTSFLTVLILVTLELSIASPGTTSAWTIMFETLSMPTSYVGLFTVYRLLCNNYSAACTEAYFMLEEVEAAYKLDGINKAAGENAAASLT